MFQQRLFFKLGLESFSVDCHQSHQFLLYVYAPICASLCAQTECQEVRKKKDLELQILTEPIRNWEGDDIKTLGPVIHMSQVTVHTQNCQVHITTCKQLKSALRTFMTVWNERGRSSSHRRDFFHLIWLINPTRFGLEYIKAVFVSQEANERYLVLFPHTLIMLSASLRMSGFIYQVR